MHFLGVGFYDHGVLSKVNRDSGTGGGALHTINCFRWCGGQSNEQRRRYMKASTRCICVASSLQAYTSGGVEHVGGSTDAICPHHDQCYDTIALEEERAVMHLKGRA